MEALGLTLLAAGLLFPQLMVPLSLAALAVVGFSRYRRSRLKEEGDRRYIDLLFALSSYGRLTERRVVAEMESAGFHRAAATYSRTGKLHLPEFGWRSRLARLAILTSLEAGSSLVLKAIEQITRQEEAQLEAAAALSEQRYSLIASLAIVSAIMGLVSPGFLPYVLAQSLLGAFWLSFTGTDLYGALALMVPLSLSSYLLALHYL